MPIRTRILPAPLLAALLTASLLPAACQPATVARVPSMTALHQIANQPLATTPWKFGHTDGTLITTPHFRLYTTIKDPLYQRLLVQVLEAAHDRFAALNGSHAAPGLMDCYVFGTRPDWELFTRLRMGSNAPVYLQISAGGYCQEGVFAGYDIGRDSTLSVVAHEAFHQYSWFAYKDRLPSWLEEGLATQSEALAWEGATPRFEPKLNDRRRAALRAAVREKRLWKLEDLTTTHAGRVVQKSQKQVDAYYAQLWALVLFLEQGKYRPGLQRLLADARQGTLSQSLAGTGLSQRDIQRYTERWNQTAGPLYLRKYIHHDLHALEKEYIAFMRNLAESAP